MAPITHFKSVTNLFRRSLPLLSRDDTPSPVSPMELGDHLRGRAAPPPNNFHPSNATVDPTTISNNGIFALFGIIGAGLVLAGIWFFFWAKNGGFRFRKGDWAEYKSTVLRRKGPNGTLLSGATPSTRLGGGSVVGSQGSMSDMPPAMSEKAPSVRGGGRNNQNKKKERKKTKPSHDADVRAYRHEKSAKVGGFNRQPDGWSHAHSGTSQSVSGNGTAPSVADWAPGASARAVPPEPRTPRGRHFSYAMGSEATFSVASDDSHKPLRSSPQRPGEWSGHSTPSGTPRHSRQPSPTKRTSGQHQGGQRSSRHSARASMPGSYAEPLDLESRYQESEGDGRRGTKSYYHPIPGLGRNAGNAGGAGGFRRGGGGRRDSLSDSEGETGTYRS